MSVAQDLQAADDAEGEQAVAKATKLREQYDIVLMLTEQRIKLALSYVSFHKKAQQVCMSSSIGLLLRMSGRTAKVVYNYMGLSPPPPFLPNSLPFNWMRLNST